MARNLRHGVDFPCAGDGFRLELPYRGAVPRLSTAKVYKAMRLKQSIARYRTFNGETYIAWLINPTTDRVALYRARGVKCRTVDGEVFIREDDKKKAKSIDYEIDP